MSSVIESWDRIHRWLDRNAAKIRGCLNPGASAGLIEAAEEAMGVRMPEDWRELYRVHDGMNDERNLASLFHGMVFLSLERVVAEHRRNMDTMRKLGSKYRPDAVRAADPGIQRVDMYNLKWVPLAHDGGETLLHVDMDPAAEGHRGQVICSDYTFRVAILLGSSVGQFVEGFADDLEGGRYSLMPDALADGQEFLGCVTEIDVVNWWQSPRWRHLKV